MEIALTFNICALYIAVAQRRCNMENARLRSYDFKCPCCSEPHKRAFEYFAKFMGIYNINKNKFLRGGYNEN